MSTPVELQRLDTVGIVALNRPNAANALDVAAAEALVEAATACEKDPDSPASISFHNVERSPSRSGAPSASNQETSIRS